MSARHYFAWDMLERAKYEDERREGKQFHAEMRHRLNPLQNISENNFIKEYRLNKEALEDLCDMLAYYTDLRSSQSVALESKVSCALLFYAQGSYQRVTGMANHFSQEATSVYIEVTQHKMNGMPLNKGDSGYPQRPWLMTPYSTPTQTFNEETYNAVHTSTRVLIENTFGRLKNCWRCLLQDRTLHFKPEKCSKIIITCSVLHNIALKYNVPDPDKPSEGSEEPLQRRELVFENQGANDLVRGRALRNQLAQRLASRRQ